METKKENKKKSTRTKKAKNSKSQNESTNTKQEIKPKKTELTVEQQRTKAIRALVPKISNPIEIAGNLVSDVKIVAELCQNAFWTFPFPIIGMLSTLVDVVDDNLLGYYWALLQDFDNILFNKIPILEQKPLYIASLFNSFKPKTIKTERGNFTYNWDTSFNFNGIPQVTTNIRDTTWSFQKPTGVDNGITPQTCTAMTVASLDLAIKDFSDLNQLLIKDNKLLQVVNYKDVNTYNNDVSAFSRASPYFGSGSCTSGSAYNSTENELPASSMPTLGTFVNFVSPSNRVSRRLLNGSGDAVSAFGYPFLPGWRMKDYRTVHTPIFKFLDFSELYVVVVNWMAHALTQAFSAGDLEVIKNWAPLPMGAFIGGLRQSLLQMFCASQCCGQLLTYDDGSSFEPFHMQPNTAPKVNQTMLVPAPLAEQLRALLPILYNNQDRIGHSDKNVLTYVPVWGINPGSEAWQNPPVSKDADTSVLLFDNTDGFANTISWLDGKAVGSSTYYNLNSSYFQGAINQWNLWCAWVSQWGGATSQMQGSAACNFLHMSRMINQNLNDFHMKEYPSWVTTVPVGYKREKITRKVSKGKDEITNVLVRLTDSGTDQLATEITTTITSYQPILADFASYGSLILLPKYVVSNSGEPTPQNLSADKLQIANRELFFVRNQSNTAANQTSNRLSELVNMGTQLAPGTAKDGTTEFDRVAVAMQNMGKGGFIQDILGGAASVAGIIGI